MFDDFGLLHLNLLKVGGAVSQFALDRVQAGRVERTRLPDGRMKTTLDAECDSFIRKELSQFSSLPVLSESNAHELKGTPLPERYWVMDPIDGTAHLESGSDEWFVSIALIVSGLPEVGICAQPAKGLCYSGARNRGSSVSDLNSGSVRILEAPEPSKNSIMAILPEGHGGEKKDLIEKLRERLLQFAELNGISKLVECGSAAAYLKVVEGEVDLFPNLTGNLHWDSAAQQIILEEAGYGLGRIDWTTTECAIRRDSHLTYGFDSFFDSGHIAGHLEDKWQIGSDLHTAIDWIF